MFSFSFPLSLQTYSLTVPMFFSFEESRFRDSKDGRDEREANRPATYDSGNERRNDEVREMTTVYGTMMVT
jgi:hypothetical protein